MTLKESPTGLDEAESCDGPLTRAPAVRLKPDRRRRLCTCRKGLGLPLRADKRWRSSGAPCLILRRERVPC